MIFLLIIFASIANTPFSRGGSKSRGVEIWNVGQRLLSRLDVFVHNENCFDKYVFAYLSELILQYVNLNI
jgi:hypothetical protein